MKKLHYILILLFYFALPCNSQRKVSFNHPIICEFQFGQVMDSGTAKSYTEDDVMVWIFYDLLGENPLFVSEGDIGPISVYIHKTSDGVSIWLTQGNGAHLFSIWPDGTAFWSKHNDIFGRKKTQQFRGTCKNIQ